MKFGEPFAGELIPPTAPKEVEMRLDGLEVPIQVPVTLLTLEALEEIANDYRRQLFLFAERKDPMIIPAGTIIPCRRSTDK